MTESSWYFAAIWSAADASRFSESSVCVLSAISQLFVRVQTSTWRIVAARKSAFSSSSSRMPCTSCQNIFF